MEITLDNIKALLFGVAIGDALGVPVEFTQRAFLKANPVVGMREYGTHNQPKGTFSDDSSLTFCLAEVLTQKFSLEAIAQNFIQWYKSGYWAVGGKLFDIGIATRLSISNLMNGVVPDLAGGMTEDSNGNGSLMRIAPLVFYLKDKKVDERFMITKQVSSITHRHIRSVIACFYYVEFARKILEGQDKFKAYHNTQIIVSDLLSFYPILSEEISRYNRLLKEDIYTLDEDRIQSSGYVIHTLEASIWSILTTNSYEEAVLKAVNLGSDTDTTAAVTGGLAGLIYGFDSIPADWINTIAKRTEIEDLAIRLKRKM